MKTQSTYCITLSVFSHSGMDKGLNCDPDSSRSFAPWLDHRVLAPVKDNRPSFGVIGSRAMKKSSVHGAGTGLPPWLGSLKPCQWEDFAGGKLQQGSGGWCG